MGSDLASPLIGCRGDVANSKAVAVLTETTDGSISGCSKEDTAEISVNEGRERLLGDGHGVSLWPLKSIYILLMRSHYARVY